VALKGLPRLVGFAVLLAPMAAGAEPEVQALAVSDSGSCAVDVAGQVYCWGVEGVFVGRARDYGARFKPTRRPGLDKITRIALGDGFGCAIDGGGAARCWGKNGHGRLGTGKSRPEQPADFPNPDEAKLFSVEGDLSFVDISAGDTHTCGVTTAGRVACWGGNGKRQVGGSGLRHTTPQLVAGLSRVKRVHSAGNYTCATTRAGAVHCWGTPRWSEKAWDQPVRLNLKPVEQLSLKEDRICALTGAASLSLPASEVPQCGSPFRAG